MEYISCALCGADDKNLLFEGHDEWHGQKGLFPTVQCKQCGHIYITPRPDRNEIGAYYPDQYAPYFIAIEDEPSRWHRFNRHRSMSKRVKLIQSRLPNQGHMLDVGCATGIFMAALRDSGWITQGVEFSAYAANYARTRHKLDVFTGELIEADLPDKQFDLIVFWDVLEHVHQPRQNLLEAARLAKPDGTLLLVLPNPDSFETRMFGQYWAGWDTPRHLHIYSQDVIEQFLEETGWQMGETHCITGRNWLFNLSLEHWLQNKLYSAKWRKLIMAIARSLPIRLLSLPYFIIAEWLKKGSVIAVFAQRKET